MGGAAVVYSMLLYDAANPAFGERRVQRLLDRDVEDRQRKLAAREEGLARAQEISNASRDHMHHMMASLEAARAQKLAAGQVQERVSADASAAQLSASTSSAAPK